MRARSQNTEPTFQALLRFTNNRAFKCILIQLYEDAHFYEKDAEIAEDRQKIIEAEQREIQEAKEEIYFESLMEDRDK
jgi:hypothetical protein